LTRPDVEEPDPAALAGALLVEEAKRQAEQTARSEVTVLPDDLPPGVGEAHMGLRETMQIGGATTITILALLTMAEQFGIQGRGKFYDETGAIRDVIENHPLQVVG